MEEERKVYKEKTLIKVVKRGWNGKEKKSWLVFRIFKMGFFNSCYTLFLMAGQTIRMDKDLKKILVNVFRVIYIVLILYVAYQILKAIFSGSWETENIIIAGMGIILAGMFVIVGFLISQSKCLGTLEERTENIGESLFKLGSDFKQHLKNPRK